MVANPFRGSFSKTGPEPSARELAKAMRAGLEQRCSFPLSPNLPSANRGELHYHANTLDNPISVKATPYSKLVYLMRKVFKVLLRPWLEMQTRFNHATIESLEKLHADLYALQTEIGTMKNTLLKHDNEAVPARDDRAKEVVVTERILETLFLHTRLPRLPARLLDLGCSGATSAMEMASLGYQVVGMDLDPQLMHHPNFQLIRGDLGHLPFPDQSFDGVVCLSTLARIGSREEGTISEGATNQQVIAEVQRVLRRGGRLILTVPFGKAAQTLAHRVYDLAMLDRLLKPFRRLETAFGARDGENWSLVSDATFAEAIDSAEHVRAVALVVAEKV